MGQPIADARTPTTPTRLNQPRAMTPTGQLQQARHEGEQHQPQPSQANVVTETAEPRIDQLVFRDGSPTPLCSQTVDKVRHDAICGLLNIRSNEKAQELSQSLALTGLPYKEWWLEIAATRTTGQWQIKLLALGMPEQQVEDAGKEQIGILLFQHFDSEGNYHEAPLQTLPPTAG